MEHSQELTGIKNLLQQMAERQEEMAENQKKMADNQGETDKIVRTMDKTLTQLNQTVVGNPLYGQKGLVAEVDDIRKYVDNDKLVKNKIAGGLVVVGIVWTVVLQYISSLFTGK
jgi:ferritin-like metal-binding protein YciE